MEPLCTCSLAAQSHSIAPVIGAGIGLLFLGSFAASVWLRVRHRLESRRKKRMQSTARSARQAMDQASDAFVKRAKNIRYH